MRIRSLAFAATAAGAVVAVATMGVSAQGPEMKMDAPTKAVAVLIPTKSGAGVAGHRHLHQDRQGDPGPGRDHRPDPPASTASTSTSSATPARPTALAAGGHFNPKKMVHGDPSKTAPRHLGDLGNIEADASGKATYDMVDPDLPLSGPMSIIGHGVVVHEKADDFGQPTGNAGGRLAVGVIGVAKGS